MGEAFSPQRLMDVGSCRIRTGANATLRHILPEWTRYWNQKGYPAGIDIIFTISNLVSGRYMLTSVPCPARLSIFILPA